MVKSTNDNRKATSVNKLSKQDIFTYIFVEKPIKEPIFWVKRNLNKDLYFASGLVGGL